MITVIIRKILDVAHFIIIEEFNNPSDTNPLYINDIQTAGALISRTKEVIHDAEHHWHGSC